MNSTIVDSTAVDAAVSELMTEGHDLYGYETTFRDLSFCIVSGSTSQFGLCGDTPERSGYLLLFIFTIFYFVLYG